MRSANLTGAVVLRPLLNCKEQDDPVLIEAIRFSDHLLGISMEFHKNMHLPTLKSSTLVQAGLNMHPHYCLHAIYQGLETRVLLILNRHHHQRHHFHQHGHRYLPPHHHQEGLLGPTRARRI